MSGPTVTPDVGSGLPAGQVPHSFVRRIRRHGGDRPTTSRVLNDGGIDSEQSNILIPPNQAGRFSAGTPLEFDDGTNERMEVLEVDPDTGTLNVLRGVDGTESSPHDRGAPILIRPRWSYLEVMDAAFDILHGEFWPYVWVPGETQFEWEIEGHYAPTVSDIESVVFAYQMVSGYMEEVPAHFLSPHLVDDAAFPNGMIVVSEIADTSTLHVAFRRRPTFANMAESQVRMLALGTAAHLMMHEETVLVAPDADATTRSLYPGSRMRSGAMLWERFTEMRNLEYIRLTEDEQRMREHG